MRVRAGTLPVHVISITDIDQMPLPSIHHIDVKRASGWTPPNWIETIESGNNVNVQVGSLYDLFWRANYAIFF